MNDFFTTPKYWTYPRQVSFKMLLKDAELFDGKVYLRVFTFTITLPTKITKKNRNLHGGMHTLVVRNVNNKTSSATISMMLIFFFFCSYYVVCPVEETGPTKAAQQQNT